MARALIISDASLALERIKVSFVTGCTAFSVLLSQPCPELSGGERSENILKLMPSTVAGK